MARWRESDPASFDNDGDNGDNNPMLHVDYQRWDQSPEHLRLFAQEASHRRTRERFLALYEITQGKNATQVAQQIGREDETVHTWVHRYNAEGAQALVFKRPGGRPPFGHRLNRL